MLQKCFSSERSSRHFGQAAFGLGLKFAFEDGEEGQVGRRKEVKLLLS